MRKLLVLALGCVLLFTAALFAGPASSGALLLLLPTSQPATEHDLPDDYVPLNKGGIDLATGFYVRRNEDLIVRGTPALILRRTSLSGYRVSKQFGIGTTHDGEIYLHGDGERFQWAELIHANGSRIRFNRTSPGTSLLNAMYLHTSTPSEWQGARLGWTGGGWAVRRLDGGLDRFQPCGPGVAKSCSIIESRDADGHMIVYERDRTGRLLRMSSEQRWIAFEYDGKDRVVRALTSTQQEARYEYDVAGRLSRVTAGDGSVRRYTYTDRDELATIDEPGTSIENIYDASGRCIKQINRYSDGSSFTFAFDYQLRDGAVIETNTTRSDGTWTTFTWSANRYSTSEAHGRGTVQLLYFTYDRDAESNVISGLSVTCPDRTGRPLRHTRIVRNNLEWLKADVVSTHCSLSDRSWRKTSRMHTDSGQP